MKKIFILLLILIALPLVVPTPGRAIPAFARKYGFNCMMCHTAYPKLNDWGQRYRDNGYQLPGQAGREKTAFDSHTPIALRTTTGFNGYSVKPNEDASYRTTSGFGMRGLDLLAAGVLHKNISALIIYTPRIDEPFADYTGSGESQPGALESASIIFSNIIPNAFNVRVGRFEPAYHLLSSKRSYYLLSSYDVYEYQTGRNDFVFGDNQIGVEATGHFRSGFKYGAGVVNGTGAKSDNNKFKDVYLTLSQTIGAGDGQSAGQRIAAFVCYGKQPLLSDSLPAAVSPTGEYDGCDNKAYYRYGGSASFNWKTFNLAAMYMRGLDDKALNTIDEAKDYEYDGGLVELDYAGLWNNRLVASVLYNWVAPPDYDKLNAKINAYSALVRCYLGDLSALNVALHGEYTYRKLEAGEVTMAENVYSVLVDLGF
ncbi:MAG: hypothetical protein PHD74_10175 [Candidatus Krumholzibacteria bacterium]|nr:hypothetical protein [Candidatus Krumholzibacteria bacterium]